MPVYAMEWARDTSIVTESHACAFPIESRESTDQLQVYQTAGESDAAGPLTQMRRRRPLTRMRRL
jgi:hypothetical protein